MDVENLLETLAAHIEAQVPEQDSRWSADCPPLSQLLVRLETGAEPTQQEVTHPYCVAVRTAYRHQSVPLLIPDNSAPLTNISAELREYAAQWLAQNQPGAAEELAGHFDSDGTLHLSLHSLSISGRVKVRLIADEMPLNLIEAEVSGGYWEAQIALPEWNLRSVRLARACVELVPL